MPAGAKNRLVRLVRNVGRRSKLRRMLFYGWVALWLIGFLAALELAVYLFFVDWHGIGRRALHPYLMNGNYYEFQPYEALMEREGPAMYGYHKRHGHYVFGFDQQVGDMAVRGNFLFQDRVQFADDITNKDMIRVFVIGGSAAYGLGASSIEKRWYVLLEQSLTATLAREVRLIPAAMTGYVSTQERLVLELIVLPRCPDAIIILDGFNDAALPAIFGSRPGDPYDQGVRYERFYSTSLAIKLSLARYSHAYRYLLKREFRKAFEENRQNILDHPELLANYAQSTSSVYLHNVLDMLRTCDQEGIPCAVFLQPALALTLRNRGREVKPSADVLTLAAYDRILERIHRLPSRTPIYDLTSVFNGPDSENWYLDTVHFIDPGHKTVATTMYPVVRAMLEKQLRSSSVNSCAGKKVVNGQP